MYKQFLPHRWISLVGLEIICRLLFYVAFTVAVYALVRWGLSFVTPAQVTSTARRIYGQAAVQGAFFCVLCSALGHTLKTLHRLDRATAPGSKK